MIPNTATLQDPAESSSTETSVIEEEREVSPRQARPEVVAVKTAKANTAASDVGDRPVSEAADGDSVEAEVTFDGFGLKDSILRGIKEAGFRSPSPIQQKALPVALSGRDIIARAQTGTGKTAAFGLPSMNAIQGHGGVEMLVIVPTRELASQVSDELYRLGRYENLRTVAVYGGQSIGRQVELIRRGAQIVTATPGRLLDHLKSGRLKNFNPSMVILDEADEMLDMGFLDDIDEIFSYLPDERQTLLFSATLPSAIRELSRKILKEPVTIDVTPKGTTTNVNITQRYYVIEEREREGALVRLIDTEAPQKALIFCRTKKETDMLCTTLV